MGNTHGSKIQRKFTMEFLNNVPFNIQVPSSLRDPKDVTFSIDQLQNLQTIDDARNIALKYLHSCSNFASVWNSNTIHPETRRLMRMLIQIQTINAVCNAFYRLLDNTRIQLHADMMANAALNTKQYSNNYQYDTSRQQRSYDQRTKIFVVNGDCLDIVSCFREKYQNCSPVVLNMASATCPGGGWRHGCGAQEENLHRRTNLFQCLEDSYQQLVGKRNWNYPIPEFGGIYSPNVSVFRGSEARGYPFFPNGPEYISFIACAAYAYPSTTINKDGEMELYGSDVIHNTMKKMETILKIALDNEHDTVILSAFGCGAFRNPPRHIAKLFHKLISEKYSQSFKYLIFAIIDDHNSMKSHNQDGNIKPFADIFNEPILSLDEF
ncbi:unnamed protein product [Rotaria socialis]|uniref:Microbial-type PARG catalytic domain-containing protein n=2 Tax=Rotaria socialis TaxID=392032 RepID=A0A817QYY0_9BILA|nr:unnamed protein product [Rotaria socialis]CAF3392884.1 unnamed protein product [Rotaria socialis]CAF3424836.1 unnamed protein product [Rotaria socialis]CAF4219631.1 unnamed protein product [Rotaria socialis]CAF4431851.1 unnamed protein product [Rotaria socialis]